MSTKEGVADAIRRADREREGAGHSDSTTGGAIAAAIRKARQERAVHSEAIGAMVTKA